MKDATRSIQHVGATRRTIAKHLHQGDILVVDIAKHSRTQDYDGQKITWCRLPRTQARQCIQHNESAGHSPLGKATSRGMYTQPRRNYSVRPGHPIMSIDGIQPGASSETKAIFLFPQEHKSSWYYAEQKQNMQKREEIKSYAHSRSKTSKRRFSSNQLPQVSSVIRKETPKYFPSNTLKKYCSSTKRWFPYVDSWLIFFLLINNL
jgi:hypothetical protein